MHHSQNQTIEVLNKYGLLQKCQCSSVKFLYRNTQLFSTQRCSHMPTQDMCL